MDRFIQGATATVELRGIGIASFCKKHGYFTEAMIRNKRHKFEIYISGPVFDAAGTELEKYEECFDAIDDVEITITTVGESEVTGWQRHEPGEFNRLLPGNDPNDIRWILNLEDELHGNELVKNTAVQPAEKPALSLVNIHNAYFYADMTEEDERGSLPYFFRVEDDVATPLGFIAETYGARLKSDAVTVTIRKGETSEVLTVKHIDGDSHFIKIWNVDLASEASVTDYPEIMKFLADPNGKEVELVPWRPYSKETTGDPGGWGVGTFCHSSECPSGCPHTF